jgi:hypothetical protein
MHVTLFHCFNMLNVLLFYGGAICAHHASELPVLDILGGSGFGVTSDACRGGELLRIIMNVGSGGVAKASVVTVLEAGSTAAARMNSNAATEAMPIAPL